jgi:hypothetical protein
MSTGPDAKRTQLRTLVAEMDVAIADSGDAPRAVWQRMVAVLDLGPEPAVRACPKCGAKGMSAATRCGHCWTSLTPP